MAVDQIITKPELEKLRLDIAAEGGPVYKNLEAISWEVLNRAANLGAEMAAGDMPQSEIEAEEASLTGELDEPGSKYIKNVIKLARDNVETSVAAGDTIYLSSGKKNIKDQVLWNNEKKLPATVMRAAEDTGYELNSANLRKMQSLYNDGRVFGALNYDGSGKISSSDADKMVKEMLTTGTSGLAVAVPLAVAGGAGGVIVGGGRRLVGAMFGRDERAAILAHRQGMQTAQTAGEVEERLRLIKEHKRGAVITKTTFMGAAAAGAAGAMFASSLGKGLASIGMGNRKGEAEAIKIVVRAGIEEGLRDRGVEIEGKNKGKPKKETAVEKNDTILEVLGTADDAAAGKPGEYYYSSSEEEKRRIREKIYAARHDEAKQNALIDLHFAPPHAGAQVKIAADSIKQLDGKKAVIAPGFAENPKEVKAQKAKMEGYKLALEAQGRTDIHVVQIKVEGSTTPQWCVAGDKLTAAHVNFAREEYDDGHTSRATEASGLPQKTADHTIAKSEMPASEPITEASQTTESGLQAQVEQLRQEVKTLKETVMAKLDGIAVGVTGKGKNGNVTPADVGKVISALQETPGAEVQEKAKPELVKR